MKKRILSILLALALLCTLVPAAVVPASAETTSGTCGANLTWTFDSSTGTLTIQGSGQMTYYGRGTAPWYDLKDSIKRITIGNGVAGIGTYAFYRCFSLTSVTIPDSLTRIGSNAFNECISLTSVTLPNSVTSIGLSAFYGCTALTDVTIPDSVTSIGEETFEQCTSLARVTIGNSVRSIGYAAFFSCTSLTSVTIPESVTSIGNAAFSTCTSLTSVTIGSGVTSIGSNAFYRCTALTSITIPESVTSIGESAFGRGDSLTKITVASGNQNYSNDSHGFLYNKDKTELVQCPGGFSGSYAIPDGVVSIGTYAFYHCSSLTSVTIPSGVTSIGSNAFYDSRSLTSVTIPDSVTNIETSAFSYCTALLSIMIPNSVASINYGTFDGCTSLRSVTIGNSVTSIDNYAFNGCSSLTSVTIPASVASIGYGAFRSCSSLTSVTLPNGMTSIGENAFYECTSLTSVTIPSSVTSIGANAFYHCSSLTSVTIPNGVTSIDYSTFSGCTSLTSVTIPNGVTSIGNYAFAGCSSLTSVTISSGVTSIGSGAFKSCGFLTSVTIPDGVTSIGADAFEGCSSLTSVFIPDSVTSIGNDVFYNCSFGLVIYGVAGSAAQTYANNNGISFVSLAAPMITEHPKSAAAALGSSVTFQVIATGAPLNYQWQYKRSGATAWTDWSGKTEATLAVTAGSNNGWQYRCVVANPLGTVTSNAATLTVVSKPAITTQPTNASVALGKTATFKVVASGSGLSYQWQYLRAGTTAWTNWSGKTSATLSVTAGSNNNGCRFRCVVKNSAGSVNSNAAQLTITNAAPVIQTQPANASAALGKTATFKVVAAGAGLSYQWQYKRAGETTWINWSGKTAAVLTVTAGSNNNGCRFRCVVKNSYGTVTSNAAQLTITNAAPVIDTQPSNASAALGKTATFKVVAAGSGLSYQWQYKRAGATSWTNWSGKTEATLTVTAGSNNNGCRFRCVVKNSYGTVTSNAAQLTITNAAPVIDTQPSNASAALGKTATFKVVAAGSGLSYQWQYKRAGASSWTNWSGKTSATLTVTAGSNNNGCRFRCVVKNAYGTVTSSAATLTVK